MLNFAPSAVFILLLSLLQPPPYPQPEWTTLQPADWDFSLSFPRPPIEKSRNVFSFSGRIKQTLVLSESEGSEFLAQRVQYPIAFNARVAAERLAIEKKGFLNRHSELVATHPLLFGNEPGEEFTYKVPPPKGKGKGIITSITRHFIKGTSYYSLTVTSPPDKPLPDITDRFFDSLKFGSTPQRIVDPNQTETHSTVVPADPRVAANHSMPLTDPSVTRTHGTSVAPRQPTRMPSRIQVADATPEEALRTFLLAIVARDAQALRSVALPHRDLDRLLDGPAAPPEALAQYAASLNQKPFRRLEVGERAELPGGRIYIARSDDVARDRALLVAPDLTLPINLQLIKGHWKVVANPFISASRAASARNAPTRGPS